MRSFAAFTVKELIEQMKTFKGVVILVAFLIFGMTSPLMAKLTPEIVKIAGAGIKIDIPEPTFMDAYMQFFKNIGSIALLIVVLVFSSGIVTETSKGTAQIILTRRLSRSSFVLAKFLGDALLWSLSYILSAVLCIVYTVYLFPDGKPYNLIFSMFCLWLFGLLMIAVTLLSSALFSNYALAAAGAFCAWALIGLCSGIPKIQKYVPSALENDNMALISKSVSPVELRVPVIVCIGLTAVILFLACLVLRRKEL